MKKQVLILLVLLACYAALMGPFSGYLSRRPVIEKLGYIPGPEILKVMAADHRGDVAAVLVLKTLLYFGSLSEPTQNRVPVPPDYPGMYHMLTTAVKLDPYNIDAYYFGQAFLVWDLKRVKEADGMLDYGMKYRTWDWYLPYFAGFNNAYFLHDYAKAAAYFKRVADLTGGELSVNLTGRYLYQAGETEQAIAYLSVMEKGAKNAAIKKSFATRLDAFRKVRVIEKARDRYQQEHGRLPASVEELAKSRYLDGVPEDPYGGTFYIQGDGKVRSTSDFMVGWRSRKAEVK